MCRQIGQFETYLLLYFTGILSYFLVSYLIARRLRLRHRVWLMLSISYLVGMIVGARVLYDVLHGQFSPRALLTIDHWAEGGLWGGLLAYLGLAAPLALILARHKRAALDLSCLQ